MSPASSPPIFVLSLLLLLLGAVATQSEVSTPFFEEDAQFSVSPDNNQRLSPFDEAVQPKQNEETQAHAHPMPETIGVSPLSSWSSWLRTIFINAFGLRGFDLTPMAPDSCQLKPGSPVGYKSVCESAKDAAACAALSLTCAWGPSPSPPTPPSPPTTACSGSSKSLVVSECHAWKAFFDATGGGGCSRDDPCACKTTQSGVTCQDGHITYMDLEQTSISGTIPDSISALTALTSLDLDHTSISGTIPNSISALTALGGLYLDSTSISGTIPDSISSMAALNQLDLDTTKISGSIPDSISALTKLTVLDLANNPGISGIIPQSFCSLDFSGDSRCYLSLQGSPTYACPLPSCTDKLKACGVTSCK